MLRRVGFIGLGDMGAPMARNLCGGKFEVVIHDLQEEAVAALVPAGAQAAKSGREVAERCEVIGVCVVDDAGCEAVVAAPDGLLAGAAPGTIIALHSTIHPRTVRALAARAAPREVSVIDAPITGGRHGAEAHQLRYMVGAEPDVFERALPVFETSAAQITHCCPVGSGALAKLCNNLVQYQSWLGYVEATHLARDAGLDPDVLLEVLSWIMNDNARRFLAGRNALEENADNAFLQTSLGGPLALAEKDLGLALEVGAETGLELAATRLCREQARRLFGFEGPAHRKR